MTRNRYQFGLTLLTGFFLLATLIAVLLYSILPATPATRGPLLLTAFVAILLGTLVCILFFLRFEEGAQVKRRSRVCAGDVSVSCRPTSGAA
jgi:hypothetical protein